MGSFAAVQARGQEDADRFLALGAPEVGTPGDLKLAAPPLPVDEAALARLREQKLSVTEIKAGGAKKKFFKPKVDSKDIVIFSRQLSTLVSAGVPIVQGLNILEAQAENKD